MSLKPIGDRVIVSVIEEEATTKSGIVLVESARNNGAVIQAKVVSVGDGRWEDGKRVPLSVLPDSVVYISRYGGVDVEIDGEEYLIVRESDVLATIV
jgi:chaperonin GroES